MKYTYRNARRFDPKISILTKEVVESCGICQRPQSVLLYCAKALSDVIGAPHGVILDTSASAGVVLFIIKGEECLYEERIKKSNVIHSDSSSIIKC